MNNFKGNSFQTASRWDQADSVRERNRKNPWRDWSGDVESKRMSVYDSLKNLLRATDIVIHKPRPCLRPWWKQHPGASCCTTATPTCTWSKLCCIHRIVLMMTFCKILFYLIGFTGSTVQFSGAGYFFLLFYYYIELRVHHSSISEQLCGLRGHYRANCGQMKCCEYKSPMEFNLNALGHVTSPVFHASTRSNAFISSWNWWRRWKELDQIVMKFGWAWKTSPIPEDSSEEGDLRTQHTFLLYEAVA